MLLLLYWEKIKMFGKYLERQMVWNGDFFCIDYTSMCYPALWNILEYSRCKLHVNFYLYSLLQVNWQIFVWEIKWLSYLIHDPTPSPLAASSWPKVWSYSLNKLELTVQAFITGKFIDFFFYSILTHFPINVFSLLDKEPGSSFEQIWDPFAWGWFVGGLAEMDSLAQCEKLRLKLTSDCRWLTWNYHQLSIDLWVSNLYFEKTIANINLACTQCNDGLQKNCTTLSMTGVPSCLILHI